MSKPKLRSVTLAPHDPHSALRREARQAPERFAAVRHLTAQQLKNPLIRGAAERLGNIHRYRGQYLRRLDQVHGSGGRRTRSEKFAALAQLAEQILVRLDLATGVLGYLDPSNGRYVLNTQCGMAEDAGLSAPVVCRLFQTLDAAGYCYRRIERVRLDETDENGLHLVRTRVLVRFTRQFWRDLGLAYVHERVQKAAKKRRESQLRDLAMRQLSERERYSREQHRREVSRQRWEAKNNRAADDQPPAPNGQAKTTDDRGGSVQSSLDRLMRSVANKSAG
jgi:hypothetical protein